MGNIVLIDVCLDAPILKSYVPVDPNRISSLQSYYMSHSLSNIPESNVLVSLQEHYLINSPFI
jgi:predicted P-loop ATPase/GTPase